MGAVSRLLEQQGSGEPSKSRDLLIANAELSALCMRTAAKAIGLDLFSGLHAGAVTAIKAPEGVSSSEPGQGIQERVRGRALDGQAR